MPSNAFPRKKQARRENRRLKGTVTRDFQAGFLACIDIDRQLNPGFSNK
jgi:hypothetical protein